MTETTWRVKRVESLEGSTVAELARVEWYRKNPAYDEDKRAYDEFVKEHGQEAADERFTDEPPPEFLDAAPGEDGAAWVEVEGSMKLAIERGGMWPGDDVVMTLAVTRHGEADA